MPKTVGLVARYDSPQALGLVDKLNEYFKDRGIHVYMEDTLSGKVKADAQPVTLGKMKTDFIITIGGDGTILRTCLALPKPEPPILAVNMGVRGFLTEVEPKDVDNAVAKVLRGEYSIEKCDKLATTATGGLLPDALNDVVVSAGEPSKILYTQIIKDGQPILKCEADGIIVSTQTGSTGYSLSAGGPVLDPGIDAIVVTPICSLTVFRSMVFPPNSKITIETIRPKDMLVLIDGNYRRLLPAKDAKVTIRPSDNFTSFISFKEDFYSRLRGRLLFKEPT